MINIDIQELKRLYYDEKQSGFEIARHFQTRPAVIYACMEEHGLQRRPCAEAQKLRYAKPRAIPNIDEIVHLYFDEKLALVEVGTRIGVSKDTVWIRLWKAGYRCRNSTRVKGSCMFTASDLTEIKRLYCEEGRSAHDIAFQYDCGSPTIRIHLKRIGVRLRTIPEAQALRRKHEQAKADSQHQTLGITTTQRVSSTLSRASHP